MPGSWGFVDVLIYFTPGMFLHTLGDASGINLYTESCCGGKDKALCSRRECAFLRDARETIFTHSCWYAASQLSSFTMMTGVRCIWTAEHRTNHLLYSVKDKEEERPWELCSKYLRYRCNSRNMQSE